MFFTDSLPVQRVIFHSSYYIFLPTRQKDLRAPQVRGLNSKQLASSVCVCVCYDVLLATERINKCVRTRTYSYVSCALACLVSEIQLCQSMCVFVRRKNIDSVRMSSSFSLSLSFFFACVCVCLVAWAENPQLRSCVVCL